MLCVLVAVHLVAVHRDWRISSWPHLHSSDAPFESDKPMGLSAEFFGDCMERHHVHWFATKYNVSTMLSLNMTSV